MEDIQRALLKWRIEANKRQLRTLSDSARDYLIGQYIQAELKRLNNLLTLQE